MAFATTRTGLVRFILSRTTRRLASLAGRVALAKRLLVLLIVVVGALTPAAADAGVVLQYNFNTNDSPTTVDPNATSTGAITYGAGLAAHVPSSNPGAYTSNILSVTTGGGQTTPALSVGANAYFQFTIQATSGNVLNLTSLTFDLARGGPSTPRGWALETTQGGLGTSPSYIVTSADCPTARSTLTPFTVSLSGSAYQGITGLETFRLYIYADATGKTMEFDNLTLNGSIVPLAVGSVWSGVTNTDWGTGTNWQGNILPASGASITFGSPSANANVDLGGSDRTVNQLMFLPNVGTTIASTSQKLVLDNGGTAVPVSVGGGTHAITSAVVLNSDAAFTVTAGQLTLGGNVNDGSGGARGLSLAAASGGTLVLGGTNGYTGATGVAGGTLAVTGTLGNTGAGTAVNVTGGTLSLQNAVAVSRNTITVSGTGSLTQSAVNAISGTAALSVTGGTATLSQDNNYNGGTIVSGGKLLITGGTGTAAGSGGVAINAGGALGGSGILNAATVTGGTIAPHIEAGSFNTLTVNTLIVNDTSSYLFNLGAPDGSHNDKLIAGALTLNGTQTLNVAFPAGLAAGTYELMHYNTSLTGTPTINVAGPAAVNCQILLPGDGGNPFPNSYALTTTVLTAAWTGATNTNWSTTPVNNWTGTGGTSYIDGQPVVFTDAGNNTSITATTAVNPYSMTFSNNTKTYTIGGTGVIGGTAPLTVAGTGRVIFNNGNNTFSGLVWIKSGELDAYGGSIRKTVPSVLGQTATPIQLGDTAAGTNDAVLHIHGGFGGTNMDRDMVVNAGNSGTKTLLFTDGGNNGGPWSGAITMNDTLNVVLDTADIGTLQLSGPISGAGNLVVKRGTTAEGRLDLSNTANSYTGQTIILGGTVRFPQATIGATAGVLGMPSAGNEEIILGDTSGSANVTLGTLWDARVTVDASRPIRIRAGSLGNITLTADPNAGNYTINSTITMERNLTIAPNLGPMTINGRILAGTTGGDLIQTPVGTESTTYTNAVAPQNINTRINGNTIRWQPGGAVGIALAGGESFAFGTGDIYVNGGNFEFYVTDTSSTGSHGITLTNPIHATGTTGGVYGWQDNAGGKPIITFSGGIDLAGVMAFGSRSTGGDTSNPMLYTGTVTINQTTSGARALSSSASSSTANLTGNIVDGAGTCANPLILRSMTVRGNTGAGNTYAGGTIVDSGTVTVNPDSRLGLGGAIVLGGAKLVLNASTNVSSGKTIHVASNVGSQSVLRLTYNGLPAITGSSNGVLGIDTAGYDAVASLATLGNGSMFLGSGSAGEFSGLALAAGSGSKYRLGGGGGTLTVTNGVLTGPGNSLEVGTGGINGAGTVVLNAANTYGGGTTVNLGSTLRGLAQASGTPFGSTTAAVTLAAGATLQLDGVTTATSTTIGALGLDGVGQVKVNQTGAATTTLNIASLSTRSATAPYALQIQGSSTDNSSLGVKEQVLMAAGAEPTVNNGIMVSPYFFANNLVPDKAGNYGRPAGDFLTYDNSVGFKKATYTPVAAGALTGSGVANQNNIVDITGAQTLAASESVTVYALRANYLWDSSSVINTTSATINVTSGGVFLGLPNSTDYKQLILQPTLAFGAAEGVINVGANGNNASWLLNGISGSAGLTKTGGGTLVLQANNSAALTGQVSVLQGMLYLNSVAGALGDNNDSELGAATNVVYLNGGTLQTRINAYNSNRHIDLGPSGGSLTTFEYATPSYSGLISGAGTLTFGPSANNPATFTLAGLTANTYSGGTVITNNNNSTTVVVNAASSLGSGDVALINPYGTAVNGTVLTLKGDANIASTAHLSTVAGTTVNFQSLIPAIGSLEGMGSVVLGTSTVATNLTVGGNNASTAFYGIISQTSALKAGALTKTGTGTFTLAGANTYTGATTINDGALSVGASANLGGAASNLVFDGGTLQITGTGLTSFSGIGHTVVLNAGKTVGLDINNAANTFTVDQVLNQATGGFTKSGAGTAILNQTNTYTGATAVNGGTLNVTGSIADTSGVTVASGAVLDLANTAGPALAAGTAYTSVTNNGTMNVSSLNEKAGAISGIGATHVTSSLTADSIVQGTLSIGAGGVVTIRETTGGSASTVPEPGTWVLIGTALLGWLAFRRRR